MSVRIFVGFGGSGGKALVSMVRQMSDDHELSSQAERRHCFLLVDTDRGELETASEDIKKELKRVFGGDQSGDHPMVETLDLAANVDHAYQLVGATIGKHAERSRQDGEVTPELKAVLDHWHFKREATEYHPFDCRRLPRPLKDGAGQCPAVGHLAMWHKLPQLREILQRLSRNIRNRGNEGQGIDLLMVGSLAGGTGRGCWQLLAMGVKQHFTDECEVKPVGFFLDASCFESAVDLRYHWRLHVNAATGISEIVAHLRNLNNDPLGIRVPHLGDPSAREPAVDTGGWASAARSPLTSGYLFSRDSDAVALSREDMFVQVGRAMYAFSCREPVIGAMANEACPFGALGAGAATVPITGIRDTIKAFVKAEALGQMLADDPEACKDAVQAVEPLLGRILFRVQPAPTTAGWSDDPDGLVSRCRKEYFNTLDLAAVREVLDENGDLEAVMDAARGSLKGNEVLAAQVVNSLLKQITEESFRAEMSEKVRSFLKAESFQVARAKAFVKECKRRVDGLCDAASNARDQTVRGGVEKDFREFLAERSGRSFPVVGKRWSDGEKGEIEERLRALSWEGARRRVFREIFDVLTIVDTCVERAVVAVDSAIQQLEGAKQSLRQNAEEEKSKWFLPSENGGNHGLASRIVSWVGTPHKLNRMLRPTLELHQVSDLVREAKKGIAFRTASEVLFERIRGLFEQYLNGTNDRSISRHLSESIEAMVERLDVPADKLRKQFSIARVLESMERRFRSYLNDVHGNSREVERTQSYIESFFGRRFVMEQDNTQYKQIPTDELFHSLCYSLAQVTDPMLHVPREALEGGTGVDNVSVMVPRDLGFADSDTVVSQHVNAAKEGERDKEDGQRIRTPLRTVENFKMQADPGLHFAVFSFTQKVISIEETKDRPDPFKGYASIERSWAEPQVLRWLRRCEGDRFASDGSYWSDEDNSFGIGFVLPCMLLPDWKALRWKPWITGAEVGQRRRRVVDAVLYAMVGNMDSAMLNDTTDGVLQDARTVRDMASRFKPDDQRAAVWRLPLLCREDNGVWRFSRRSFVFQQGSIIDGGAAWQEGRSFSTLRDMIKQLGLGAEELTAEGSNFVDAIEAERKLVSTSLLPNLEDEAGPKRRESLNKALTKFLDNYQNGYLAKRQTEQKHVEEPLVKELKERLTKGTGGQFSWDRLDNQI